MRLRTGRRTFALMTVGALLAVPAAQAADPGPPAKDHGTSARANRPRLTLTPRVVAHGDRLTFIGSGFRPNLKVWLGVGPPQSEARYWGSTRANRSGAFRKTLTVRRRLEHGRWIALACQLGFRIKAGASFRMVAGHG